MHILLNHFHQQSFLYIMNKSNRSFISFFHFFLHYLFVEIMISINLFIFNELDYIFILLKNKNEICIIDDSKQL